MMTDEITILGWRCYVSGDGLRVARSPHGEGVSVTKDGDLGCDDTYVPAAVVRWLMERPGAVLRAAVTELVDTEEEQARYEAIKGLRLAFLRFAYDMAPGPPIPEERELPSGYAKTDIDGASIFLEEFPTTEQEQHGVLCDLFKRQREREQDRDQVLDGAVMALRDALAAVPCPQCHQTHWQHKLDCSQGDLERVASHPRQVWDGSRRPRCPGCNEVDGGHLAECPERAP